MTIAFKFGNGAITLEQLVEPRKHGRIAEATVKALEATFNERGHKPSAPQWLGLNDLANQLEAMAEGKLKPLFYLSSLDPGVGKTTVIIEFMRNLLASKDHENVAALICLGRLAEIRSLVAQMGLKDEEFSVVVGKDREENALGNQNKTAARVMFTTQQLLENKVRRSGGFVGIQAYHYNGNPRQVRVWDEACLPARPLCINLGMIQAMLHVVAKTQPALHSVLSQLIKTIEGVGDGAFVDIPNFEEKTSIGLNAALGIFGDEKRGIRDAANDLWLISGKTVIARYEAGGNTVLDYENTLPDDLKPVVICDASGHVRKAYRHWADGRGDLVYLQHGPKDYSNLHIHMWRKGGGKSSWNENWSPLIEGIVQTINGNNEPWLVVHHKQTDYVDINIPALIRDKVNDPERISFVHWGDHSASNDYRDIKNVILAGTLFYEPSYYEAMGRLSRGIKPGEVLDRGHFAEIKAGEHANNILQAASRGSVRKSQDNKCAPCDLYIIADLRNGVEASLPEIFSGHQLSPWEPVPRELKGHVRAAVEFITANLSQGQRLKVSRVRDHLGVSNRDFGKDILGHRDFEGALAAEGVFVDRKKGRGGSDFIRR